MQLAAIGRFDKMESLNYVNSIYAFNQSNTKREATLYNFKLNFYKKKIFLTKFTTPEGFNDEKRIDEFFKTILDNISERNMRAVPILPKIVQFFKKNPSYKELLPPGIRL